MGTVGNMTRDSSNRNHHQHHHGAGYSEADLLALRDILLNALQVNFYFTYFSVIGLGLMYSL